MRNTNWSLIRNMMNAAIDFCERVEAAGYTEADRDADVVVNEQPVTVQDILTSAWTYPENMRYEIIRMRYEDRTNLAYVPEMSRILTAMAEASAELVGGKGLAEEPVRRMITWFEKDGAVLLETAIKHRRSAAATE
ncbi:hypothetical protein DFR48_101234 [Ciceribacter lividus]|uniref:Uncharacterized protein n=1 Tax=Ciceribacter lividus TaxID=1197950 RepID=A0A6I7HTT3_9HYPH|nr:hypothetical protein [Ciceribacter lividus]RCW28225.1 hypothetical protein DFR48_101234 [Ciceribacter lividus]